MKNIVIISALAVALSACGSMSKTQRTTANETSKETDSLARSIEMERVTMDTTVTLPGDTVTGSKPASDILDGDSLVLESSGQSVVVKYDKATKNLKARSVVKPRAVPVKAVKETVRASAVRVQNQDTNKTATSDMQQERKGASGFPWGVAFGLFAVLAGLALIIFLRSRKIFGL
jgi:ABC-type Fe3+-hydroxamate transport system substrate-binding protein